MSLVALARAWMASAHWGGWRVGMVTTLGCVVWGVRPDGQPLWHSGGAEAGCLDDPVPDLTHPGTLAFLLEDVRRAQRASVWVETCGTTGYRRWRNVRGEYCGWSPRTDAAQLMAALRAAPEAA